MGIPSFYKHLLRKYKGITAGSAAALGLASVDLVALDFNCIIYSAMKTMPNAFSPAYEEDLLREVGVWLDRICTMIPSSTIYIAVDGAVPCAKIHQQRLRRYKSVWLSEQDAALRASLGLPEKAAGWDRNAITPGTQFMDKMNSFLSRWAKKQGSAIVSGTDEPGEGEHKIMRFLKMTSAKNVVIYGMDADLIAPAAAPKARVRATSREAAVTRCASRDLSIPPRGLRSAQTTPPAVARQDGRWAGRRIDSGDAHLAYTGTRGAEHRLRRP